MSLVSNNIKYLRRLNRLTQEQFASQIGIKRSLLGAYEEARANPNLDNLIAIAQVFNTTVDNLLKNDLQKIRETPEPTTPIDDINPSFPSTKSLLPNNSAVLNDPPAVPKLPSTILNSYQGLTSHPMKSQSRTINLVAQRIVPRPISQRNGFAPLLTTQPILSFNNASDTNPTVTSRIASERSLRSTPLADNYTSTNLIHIVYQHLFRDYEQRYHQRDFLTHLPILHLPGLPIGHYRAFEADNTFSFPNSLLIGQFVRNWYDIADGKLCILVLHSSGIFCRRVFNHVKVKGTLLLMSDQSTVPNREIPIQEVLEVWEIKAFIGWQLPEPPTSLERLRQLVDELRFEIDRIQKKITT